MCLFGYPHYIGPRDVRANSDGRGSGSVYYYGTVEKIWRGLRNLVHGSMPFEGGLDG